MNKRLVFFACMICWLNGSSQGIDTTFIKSWLYLFDSVDRVPYNSTIYIDGKLYDWSDHRLSQHLLSVPATMVLTIEKKNSISYYASTPKPDRNGSFVSTQKEMLDYKKDALLITIKTVKYQNRDEREDSLAILKKTFSPTTDKHEQHGPERSNHPAVYIDGVNIGVETAQEQILHLKPYAVYAIHQIPGPASVNIWGEQAVNGVVRIWTRQFVLGK